MTFQELGLIEPILKALGEQGYRKPSPIQEKAIPPALAGRDVLGCAQTGTGKTCAFASPILQTLHGRKAEGRPIRALILTPTRELALQIQESFQAYGKYLPLRSCVIFGGVGQQNQVDALKRGVDILVATPGRLLDLQGQGYVDLSKLEIFVLDEADRMLDMGFIHDVRRVLKLLPERKQTLFFSATMPPEVMELVNSLLKNAVKVAVDPVSSPVEVIEQSVYLVDKANKTKLLSALIEELGVKNALVFTRTKHGANKVAGDLMKAGITAAAIHGNKSQTARQQALSDFKAGKIRCLVATDIAARGLDIEELSHVFNYNLPEVPETYIHRIGRTGRAGRGGVAVSFCDFGEKPYLKEIEKLIGKKVPEVENHPWPMAVFESVKRDAHGRVVNADDEEARAAARARKAERRAQSGAKKPAEQLQPKPQPKPQPQPAPRKTAPQTPAEKRRASGYKASKTLDDALRAMSPKTAAPEQSERSAAFEAWMAEERAIQAGKAAGRQSALDGDVIMDATARLLAPRSPSRTERPGGAPSGRSRRGDSAARQERKAPRPEGGQEPPRSGKKKNASPAGKKQPPKGTPAPVKQPAARKPEPERGEKKPAKNRAGARRGRGAEMTLRSSQKDSTEQPSLMKPYYISYED